MNIDKYKAIIFDLDGVIVSTDMCHYKAWKHLADDERIYFDAKINERLRGVSRMESLEIILEHTNKSYTDAEKIEMTEKKNRYYIELINQIDKSAILNGSIDFVNKAKANGIKVAIGSSSKNTKLILEKIECDNMFDAVADGNDIKNSKPDPEVFFKAAEKLGIEPCDCLVVEDADAGVEAALNAGMEILAVGSAAANNKATYAFKDLKEALE